MNGSQCTIVWHVDDLKVSHRDEAVVTYFAQELGRRNRDKLKIKRGKVFDYLGIDLDFESQPGTMIISMIKYLDWMQCWRSGQKNSKATRPTRIRITCSR